MGHSFSNISPAYPQYFNKDCVCFFSTPYQIYCFVVCNNITFSMCIGRRQPDSLGLISHEHVSTLEFCNRQAGVPRCNLSWVWIEILRVLKLCVRILWTTFSCTRRVVMRWWRALHSKAVQQVWRFAATYGQSLRIRQSRPCSRQEGSAT